MNDQGMPELNQRDSSVQLNRDGMPQNVAVPKPAPIPARCGYSCSSSRAITCVCRAALFRTVWNKRMNSRKMPLLGLISLIVLVILAVLAWLIV